MRKTIVTLKKGLYLLLTEIIAMYLVAFPVSAFQVSSSSTGYVRVATASAISAYQVAQRAAFTGAVASAISAPTSGFGGGAARHGAGRLGAARGLGRPHVGRDVLLVSRRASGENGSPGGGPSGGDTE